MSSLVTYIWSSDLLDSDAKVIVQQCNCITRQGKGLSEAITQRFPHADVYSKRTTPSTPGTIEIRGGGELRWVCAFYAQYYPGKPSFRIGYGKKDTDENRIIWFKACLEKLARAKNMTSVAFPYNIGCGLAQGDWTVYEGMILEFAKEVKSRSKCKVYIISQDEDPCETYLADTYTWENSSLLEYTSHHHPTQGWEDFFKAELDEETGSIPAISEYLSNAKEGRIFPSLCQIYECCHRISLSDVKVVFIGQDPYHGEGQAMGIAFAVPEGIKRPPSLVNLFKEARNEGIEISDGADISSWISQGVLLINTALTVQEGKASSHSKIWQEYYTPAFMRFLDERCGDLVIVMLGNHARSFGKYFGSRHKKIEGIHPSPLSAHKGFFGSKIYSNINQELISLGREEIDWTL